MRAVKALMIGRLSLTWLWPFFCLLAMPNAQARVARAAESLPAAIVSATPENHGSLDFGIHHRTFRAARRLDLEPSSKDFTSAISRFQTEALRGVDLACAPIKSDACLSLASGWQFFWRTALSPRAPSFLS